MDPGTGPIRARFMAHREHHDYQWYLVALVACVLLIFCFLIAGLTLGVCGLDVRWLEMRSITGTTKERKQAIVVLRMKRNASWMLCSLIICSVACSEYFPFIIEALCGVVDEWVPVIISTLLIAVFAEIIPQWLIPRHAVSWGYYCSPLIWGCMWLTGIISFPLAWILDNLGGCHRDELGVFTNHQLAIIIKRHDRTERRGGNLSPEASRIILGALNNDGRDIGGDISKIPRSGSEDSARDIEKAAIVVTRGIIVKWSTVKTIDINEVVDKSFLRKVMGWSYSRIPVVGRTNTENDDSSKESPWESTKIFGFLHIKNLVGLALPISTSTPPLFVKDLPLYPLPIITDEMSVYELLYMFQLSMSRMALVIPAASCLGNSLRGSAVKGAVVWTDTQRIYNKNESLVQNMKQPMSLARAQAGMETITCSSRDTVGVRSPKPTGIITFEDIIDSLLQNTSHDEKDFFDRDSKFPPDNFRKVGGQRPSLLNIRHHTTIRGSDILVDTFKKPTSTLRKRYASKRAGVMGLDGAEEGSAGSSRSLKALSRASINRKSVHEKGLEISGSLQVPKLRQVARSSSYTENSQGGFHERKDATSTSTSIASLENLAPPEVPLAPTIISWSEFSESCHSPFKSATLPTRKSNYSIFPQLHGPFAILRHSSASPRLRQAPSSSPFSQQAFSRFMSGDNSAKLNQVIMPTSTSAPRESMVKVDSDDSALEYTRLRLWESTEDTISLSSWGGDPMSQEANVFDKGITSKIGSLEGDIRALHDARSTYSMISVHGAKSYFNTVSPHADAKATAYDGFPPELLESRKGSQNITFSSKTLPRVINSYSEDSLGCMNGREILIRERSSHDDRAKLPSQKKAFDGSVFTGVKRSSSMWL